jgi:hypothetical protein
VTDIDRSVPRRYRKKAVEIDAIQWTGANAERVREFAEGGWNEIAPDDRHADPEATAEVYDRLHSTWVLMYTGDMVIRGMRGEYYPCRLDVFFETNEDVEDDEELPTGVCGPVPCPPFTDVHLEVSERLDWRTGLWHPTPPPTDANRVTVPRELLADRWQDTSAPEWQEGAWDSETGRALRGLRDMERAVMSADELLAADLAEKLLLYGSVYVEAVDRMVPVDLEVDPDSPAGRAIRAGATGGFSVAEPPPTVEQALAVPPPVRWAGTRRPWAASPGGIDFADGPLVVGLPDGYDPEAVSSAVALCQSLGLLPDTPHGIMFLPESVERDLLDG